MMEETIIKSKMEKVELEAQIVAADVKLKVLLSHDAMHAYDKGASKPENAAPLL